MGISIILLLFITHSLKFFEGAETFFKKASASVHPLIPSRKAARKARLRRSVSGHH